MTLTLKQVMAELYETDERTAEKYISQSSSFTEESNEFTGVNPLMCSKDELLKKITATKKTDAK